MKRRVSPGEGTTPFRDEWHLPWLSRTGEAFPQKSSRRHSGKRTQFRGGAEGKEPGRAAGVLGTLGLGCRLSSVGSRELAMMGVCLGKPALRATLTGGHWVTETGRPVRTGMRDSGEVELARSEVGAR